ncbi:hypothetical protein A0256_09790 [Mucilaginibacter sp. PAMC 26640]|nr:hypothetical protein A0256_09790 [Mucilaginibacter sp. PAMC 26640]
MPLLFYISGMIRLNYHLSPLYLVLLVFATGCSNEIGSWRNDQIKASKRDDLHELNNKVFNYIKAGDTKGMEGLLSKELLTSNSIDAAVKNIGHRMTTDTFAKSDEYYTINKYIERDSIKGQATGDNAYKLIYHAYAQEMYMVFYTPTGKDVQNKIMVTAIYANYEYGWKLSFLEFQPYTLNGKTAPELFKLAKSYYSKHYLMDALSYANMANSTLRPSAIWLYNIDGDVLSFRNKLQEEADKKYKFPVVLADLPGKPRILGIFNKMTNEGNFPIVSYQTKISLKDTAAVRKENIQMRKVISVLIPGLEKNNKYIYYQSYNELPNYNAQVYHFDLMDKRW